MSPVDPRTPDPETETICGHCGELIRKRRDATGNQFEWVSYIGMVPGGDEEKVYSRLCREEPLVWIGGKARIPTNNRRTSRQHGPIPLDNPARLERWLDS